MTGSAPLVNGCRFTDPCCSPGATKHALLHVHSHLKTSKIYGGICSLSLDLILNILLDILDGGSDALLLLRLVHKDAADLDDANKSKEEVDSGKATTSVSPSRSKA